MSDSTKIILTILAGIALLSVFVSMNNDCEAKGGKLVKTMYSTYECAKIIK